MSTSRTILPWAAAAVLVAFASGCGNGRANPAGSTPATAQPVPSGARLPRLVDVGATTCAPCKAMTPILDGLRSDFSGRLEVQFIDINELENARMAAEDLGVRAIPTQIFYGADGVELSRHMGFMSREDILARWQSHGLTF
ncbi:MAG: thioredoxin family protein [Anaeromyxobacteraceae bacterium]